jgi:hypothetical protein
LWIFFDTHYFGLEVFGEHFNLSRLVKQVGIQGSHFHNAGNDANFTLRAMLLLAIHDLSRLIAFSSRGRYVREDSS